VGKVSFGAEVAAIGPIVAIAFGAGFVRRARPVIGWTLVVCGSLGVVTLALFGHLRPLVGLVGIAAFLFGLEVDQAGAPARRTLAFLSVAVGFFALAIAHLYT
jgi:uncharacterized membrane protein